MPSLSILFLALQAATSQSPRLVALKQEVTRDVASRAQFTQQMVDQIFSFAELGFQETETSRYLVELLRKNGFTVREGLFRDADVVLFSHVDDNLVTSWGDIAGNGLVSVLFSFQGRSAHAAGAPWRGRSALDAVELMDIGWNFRREHLRLQQRSHYVIPNGGDQPNVVPPNASVWYYFRETSYDEVKKLWEIGNTMAKAATMMTDTEYSMRVLGSAWPGHMNKTIAETMHANIEKVGLPQWSAADQTLA